MKNMIKTLLVAAFGAMLAWPASAGTATNITFTGQAPVGNYATDTAWSVSSGALADVGTLEQGVLTFDLDDGQYMTYAATSRTDRVATVKMEDTLFTVAFEPPAVPADSQAAIVVGAWEGTTNYYGWAGAMANGTNVWELLPTQVAITPETAVNVEMVFDYTAATKTVTFKVGETTLGSLNLADQNRARVEGITFQGSGSISDLAGTYATTMWTFDFKDGDTVVESVQVEDGDAVAEIAAPSKTGHTFDAWQSGGNDYNFASAVTADAFVTAKYDPIAYTITWIANGGTLSGEYTSGEVNYGTAIIPPTATKEADAQYTYSFDKWVPAPDATVLSNATYTAQFTSTVNSYTISWDTDGDGDVDDTTTVAYGDVPTYAAQEKAATDEHTYTWAGWSPAPVAVTGPATYTATFSSTPNTYDVTFHTNDVDVAATWVTNVPYGVVPEYDGDAPAKAATDQYTFYFAGFTNTVATVPTNLFAAVTGDVDYYAVFTNTVNQYTVTWKNDDGSTIDTTTVEYGVVPTHADATKAATAEYTYTFDAWDPAPVAVTGDAAYQATFTSSKNSYTITWKNEDGTTIDTTTVEYGVVPTHADATKAEDAENTYTFDSWDPAPVAVTGAATYTATFTATPKPVTVISLAKPTIASTVLANAQSGAVVRATIDPAAEVAGASADATVSVATNGTAVTATFTNLPWNEKVDWTLSSTGAADLPGRFYAKGETEWFNVATNAFTEVNDLADGMKGVDMSADPSAAGQMVRIQTCLEIPEGAMEEFPAGVGDARTGFAVAKIADNGDTAPAFYAYTGDGAQGVNGWVKLLGAAPAANTTNDLLIVLDVEAATARYYVEGIALYKDNAGTPVYAIPMKAFEANEEKQINGIGFANADGVLSPVVAEYDVPFEAAVGDVPYTAAADGLAAADKTGVRTLYLLTNDVAGTISLAVGESVKVDTAKGSFAEAEPVVTSAGGWLASLLAGAVFVEYVFDWKGMGVVIVDGLEKYDLPVVMGTILFICILLVLINILTDILYALLDPRVRLQ